MALLTLLNAQLAYGHWPLLDKVDFALEARERVGLIGRNGTGKSSFLKILAGLETADDGQMQTQSGLELVYVAQEPLFAREDTVASAIRSGLQSTLDLLLAYEQGLGDLDALQSAIELRDGWHWRRRMEEALSVLGLPPDRPIAQMSGGERKRVALARAWISQPDILLLDEPTNHLDIQAIEWLEGELQKFNGSVVCISHDRVFLDRICTRIVELDRGQLRSYPGNFSSYQSIKETQLAQEAVIQAKADKLLAQEEVWVRKGVEARRTRSQSRIARLEQLRSQRVERRQVLGQVRMDVGRTEVSGKIVAQLEGVSKRFAQDGGGDRIVVDRLDLTVLRGDKLAIVGPNGAGKSTLIQLILGLLPPDAGVVRQGSRLEVAYFDQMRNALDLNATLESFISPGSEWIEIGERRTHVRSYLADFLFAPERAHSPVSSLSGGERNRLLLARLFARPANVLVLDEPTNDLDIDTLELLEDLLQRYAGTVLLVSHDRQFVDQVATSILACEASAQEPGRWREYEGGIEDWISQSSRRAAAAASGAATSTAAAASGAAAAGTGTPTGTSTGSASPSAPIPATASTAAAGATPRQKLSYKEQRELQALPEQIEALEQEQQQLRQELAEGSVYSKDPQRAQTLHSRDAEIEDSLMQALERWEALSVRA